MVSDYFQANRNIRNAEQNWYRKRRKLVMHYVIAVVVALFVGAVCGYAFRGYISREKAAAGAAVQSGLGAVAKKL